MPITVSCDCGKKLRAREEQAGRKAKCPGCGAVLVIPKLEASPEEDLYGFADDGPTHVSAPPRPAPVRQPTPERPTPGYASPATAMAKKQTVLSEKLPLSEGSSRKWRDYLYLVLILTMIPLAWSVFTKSDVEERFVQTLEHNPAVADQIDSLEEEEFFNKLPDHRVEGALLSRESGIHWFFAVMSAAAFFILLMLIFPAKNTPPIKIILTGLFTGTLGILLLLGVQYVAEWTNGRIMVGRSILMIFFYIAKFIGFSYHAALDPDNNFFISFFGFTFGVGMCEEFCKAIPLIILYQHASDISWRSGCLIGLASGIGFGVSEGITYSSDYYNGVHAADMYVVRFVSCVALHAVWSGAAALSLHRHQDKLQSSEGVASMLMSVIVLLMVVMVLHGLYDTLLKKDHEALALLTAVASIGWLAWKIEQTRKMEEDPETRALVV